MLVGIDVSHWQGNGVMDCNEPVQFAILKATEGTGYTDPTFAAKAKRARERGWLLGAYHYARPEKGNTAKAEAAHFVAVVKPHLDHANGLLLALDWEDKALTVANPAAWALAFLQEVERLTGRKPLFYGSKASILSSKYDSIARAGYGLWVAQYDHTNPVALTGKTPKFSVFPWGTWALYQYTDAAAVAKMRVDGDVFNGNREQWLAYAGGKAKPEPAAPSVCHPVIDLPVLRQGDKGAAVGLAQTVLNWRGYPLAVDNSFGPLTARAAQGFQADHGLTIDEVIGAQTWGALLDGSK